MPKKERHSSIGLGQLTRARHSRPIMNPDGLNHRRKSVVLVSELQAGRFGLVASAAKPEAAALPALGFRLVTFDASLFARNTTSGASAVNHGYDDDSRRSIIFATDG
jgi:hypothetical protein